MTTDLQQIVAEMREYISDLGDGSGKHVIANWANRIESATTRAEGEDGCTTCNGRGEIGGFVSMDSGYQTDPCPDCTPTERTTQRGGDASAEAAWTAMGDENYLFGGGPFEDAHPQDQDAARRIAAAVLAASPDTARLRDALTCVLDIASRRLLLPSEVSHWQALLAEKAAAPQAQEGMFLAACDSLGRVAHDLGVDPDLGGHGPILRAIAELRADRGRLSEVCRAAYEMIHNEPVDFAVLGEMLYQAAAAPTTTEGSSHE